MNHHTDNPVDHKPWYRQFWPWFLIALPTVVIIACLYTAFLAVHNPLSLVKEDYYKEGLEINQDQQRYQQAVQWQLGAKLVLQAQRIEVLVSNKQGVPLPRQLRLQFVHPVDSSKDLHLMVSAFKPSAYRSEGLSVEPLQTLIVEKRWYVYLESDQGDWALRQESGVQFGQPVLLGAFSGG